MSNSKVYRNCWTAAGTAFLALASVHCSSNGSADEGSGGSGGAALGVAGASNVGGSGGMSLAGSGGSSQGAGGIPSVGGSLGAAGGSGAPGAGGGASAGGASAGGASAGGASAGGASAGGASAGGTSAGGASATGGVRSSGGTTSTGGVTGTGGTTTGTGGAPSTGGVTGTGGTGSVTSGCGKTPVASGNASLDVSGTSRTYIVDVPPGYDKNKQYPVLFGFHGATTSGALFRSQYYGNLGSAAGNDAILVHPDALGNPTAWDLTGNTDLAFFDALLTKLESQYCVDTNRVFAAGHSSGGYFSNVLGCKRGDVLRGIAPVSGGGPFGTCKGQVAVWIAHGTNDTTVLPAQGMASRDHWVSANGCNGSMSSPVTPSPCVEYAGCSPGYAVRWCAYDGDHTYPTFAPQGIWSFFKGL